MVNPTRYRTPENGWTYKADGSKVNIADLLENTANLLDKVSKALVTDKNAGVIKTGTLIKETALLNAVAINDTAFKYSQVIPLVGSKFEIDVESTLNQPCTVYLAGINGSAGKIARQIVNGTFVDSAISIPANAPNTFLITDQEWKALRGPLKSLAIAVVCSTAPTSGSVTVRLKEVV